METCNLKWGKKLDSFNEVQFQAIYTKSKLQKKVRGNSIQIFIIFNNLNFGIM